MGGIKDLLGFHFWIDNSKRIPIESMLTNQKQIPKDRQSILKDLNGDVTHQVNHKMKKMKNNAAKS